MMNAVKLRKWILWTDINVTSNLVRAIHCSDKRRGVRVCAIRYDVYSNLPFFKCLVSLMCTLFSIRMYEVKLDRIEQNEQYLIGQLIVTSNEWCASIGTLISMGKSSKKIFGWNQIAVSWTHFQGILRLEELTRFMNFLFEPIMQR
jgi:hypothetical protein